MTLRVVTNDDGSEPALIRLFTPTPEFMLLDEARLGYWRAVIKGNPKRIASALKAWADLLKVKRGQKAPWRGPGTTPHTFSPDLQAMGDCKTCGHVEDAHRERRGYYLAVP